MAPDTQKGRRHRARQAWKVLVRFSLLLPRHSPPSNLLKNARKDNELETVLRGPGY